MKTCKKGAQLSSKLNTNGLNDLEEPATFDGYILVICSFTKFLTTFEDVFSLSD